MEYSSKEVKVGLMVAIGFSLLVVFLVAIFGVSWSENTKEHITYLKNIPGIVPGSLVKYGGMDVSEAKHLKQLEEENRQLKELVANLSLDNHILKNVIAKNG